MHKQTEMRQGLESTAGQREMGLKVKRVKGVH